nr:unnamed protein product [Callosobruchus chinensis]
MSQPSWPQPTANTTQGYGTTSSGGARLTPEQWAAMSMNYVAQKRVVEISTETFEGHSTNAFGALYGEPATTNVYDRTFNQRTMSGYDTGTSYYGMQDTSQQIPSQRRSTANHLMTNKLYGDIKMNMTDTFGKSCEAAKDVSYDAGGSAKFSKSSMAGTPRMPCGSAMRSSGSRKGFAGTTQFSGNKRMPYEETKIRSSSIPFERFGVSAHPSGTFVLPSSAVASKGRFYGTNRQTPLEVIDLIDDSSDDDERMSERESRMGHRRLSTGKDEFSGSPGRYVGKGTYMRDATSYNREQRKRHDYKSADTNLPWTKRGAPSNRESSSQAFGKEDLPPRKEVASFNRGAWHHRDDIQNPSEDVESRLSWNKYRSSYDEESGTSSKKLYDRNGDGRSWQKSDTSFESRARNDPGGVHDINERRRPWNQQGMEEDIMPSRKRQNMEEDRMPLWKKRSMEVEQISPWKKQAFEDESMSLLRRQDVEGDTMSPWKKKVLERKMLKEHVSKTMIAEERMSASKGPRMEDGEMPIWKKRGVDEMVIQQKILKQENVSSGLDAVERSLPPWKKRIVEERVIPRNRERNEEKVSPWKKQNILGRQNDRVISSTMKLRRQDVSTPNKQKGQVLSKKQIKKAFNKRLRKLKHKKKAVSDSEEDLTPAVLDGIAMMICDKRYPIVGLKENQSKIIMDYLLRNIQNLAYNESPKFSTHKFMMSGILSIICANEHTCGWLKKKVEELKDPWKGADLIVKPFRVPAVIHIPGSKESESEVKEALQKANPYFKVHEWELMRKKNLDIRVQYTYLIDYNTFEALKVIQFRPYYKSTRVLVKMVHSAFNQETIEGSTEAVDNGKKGKNEELTEAELLLKEATQMNEKESEKSNSNTHELTDAELSEAEILLRQIEQGEK